MKIMLLDFGKILSAVKQELIYGAHLSALTGPALVALPIIFMELPINYSSLIVAYLIPLIVYSYNYQSENEHDSITNPEKTKYLQSRSKIYPALMGLYLLLLLVFLVVIFNLNFCVFMIIILIGGLLYTFIFKVLTKSLPGFKTIYTTLMWTYYGTFFMIFLYSTGITMISIGLLLFIFLKLMINITFFDIKDIEADKTDGLRTIPIILGKDNTIWMLNGLNVLALLILVYFVVNNIIPAYGIVLAIFFLYTLIYINKGRKANNRELLKFSYLMADAEFIFWPIALIVSKMIYCTYF